LSWLLLAALLTFSAAGCARASRQETNADLRIGMTPIPYPPAVGQARLVIHVTDAAGAPIDDARLSIKGDMTHAGMTPVLAEGGGGVDGYYETPFEWTMAGDWIVTVEVWLADGRRVRERFELTVLTEDEAACEDERQE
jgi:hypothetical protein